MFIYSFSFKVGVRGMKYILKRPKKIFIHIKDNVAIEVSDAFIDFIGYSRDELIGRSINQISNLLKMDFTIDIKSNKSESDFYIFTKMHQCRNVFVSCEILNDGTEKIYYFREKSNSRIEEKIPFVKKLCLDNEIGVAVWSFPKLIMLECSEKFSCFLNKLHNENKSYIGLKKQELLSKFENSSIKDIWLKTIMTGKACSYKKYKYLKNHNRYWDFSLTPIFFNGKIKYIIQTVLDVTDSVINEKIFEDQKNTIIKGQNEQLEIIIDNMSYLLFIFDKDGNFIKINKAASDFFDDLSKMEDVTKGFQYFNMDANLIVTEYLPGFRVLRGEKISEYRVMVKKNNIVKYFEVNGTPIYDKEGNFVVGIVYCYDITKKVNDERTLLKKTQYDFFNKIIESLDLPFVRLSYPDLNFIDINQKGYYYLRKLRPEIKCLDDVKKTKFSTIFSQQDKLCVLRSIKEMEHKKEKSYSRYKKVIISGEEMFVHMLYQPMIGVNGEILEIIGIAIDVTEEIKANKNMEKSLKWQEEIFSNLSHELKTPLNVIFSAAQLFELYLKNNLLNENKAKISNSIYSIKQNCYRLSRLLSNIVDMSKIESGYFKLDLYNENIIEVIEDIVQSSSKYVEGKGLSITFDTNVEEKIIAFDYQKIKRAILNLISNAIKFSRPGGEIYVDVIDKGHTVEIYISDNGIGIEKNNQNHIFSIFNKVDKSFTRNAEGSGMGLCIVKSIVELHGGRITVESEIEKGSKFKIELPVSTVKNKNDINKNKVLHSNDEMISMEFSDIYS